MQLNMVVQRHVNIYSENIASWKSSSYNINRIKKYISRPNKQGKASRGDETTRSYFITDPFVPLTEAGDYEWGREYPARPSQEGTQILRLCHGDQ